MNLKGYLRLVYKSYWGNVLVIGLPTAVVPFADYFVGWAAGRVPPTKLLRMFVACGIAGLAVAAFSY